MSMLNMITVELIEAGDHWRMYTYQDDAHGEIAKGIVDLNVPSDVTFTPQLLEQILNDWWEHYNDA